MSVIISYMERIYSLNEEYLILLFTLLIFIVVSIVIFTIVRHSLRQKEIKKRAYQPSVAGDNAVDFDYHLPRNAGMNAVSDAFSKAALRFMPEKETKASSTIRDDMIQAGFHNPSALAWYYFSRVVSAIAFPAIGYPTVIVAGLAQTTLMKVAILILLASIGMVIPSLYIMRRTRKLAAEYRDGFPEVMDLLVVCVEAGVSVAAAISRVTVEIAKTHPHLGLNLHIMSLEMRAGRNLTEAFESLAHRVTIDEVRSLGSLLQQSEELGTSLSEALRAYSKDMREKRYFRAEEKAHALPAKMTLPLGFFVFPVMLIVIMLPLLIRMVPVFSI